jgi:D-3-phosphoglycerate dehydrogenase / 2-oxoglutarate reductase
MKIAVIDDYQDAFRKLGCYARLKGHEVAVYHDTEKDAAKLAGMLKDAEAVVLTQQRSPFPRAVIERLPNLKLISQTGRNVNHIDLAACTEKGIIVSAGGAGNPNPTAELTWALILAALRRIPQEVQRMKDGKWQGSVGIGLAGKTLGIYAYGRIGSLVAGVGKAFGMKVVCWGREGSTAKARAAGFEIAASREAFFENADVICLHLPLNKETRGIVTAQDLARMKPGALIVNTSRAQLIAEGALAAALRHNVVCTPHLGYVEQGTYESYFGAAIDHILAYADGKPINVLNPDVLKKA